MEPGLGAMDGWGEGETDGTSILTTPTRNAQRTMAAPRDAGPSPTCTEACA